MRILNDRHGDAPSTPGGFQGVQARNVDTCHVWASDGDLVARVERNERVGPGIPVRDRLIERGIDPAEWWDRRA